MKKFTVKKSSAGPDLYFGDILIRSWIGTACNEVASLLCDKLNAESKTGQEQNRFTRSIEFDYNELVFLFVKVEELSKSKCSATVKLLYENIASKLEDAINDIGKEFPSTEYTPLNIHFFEDDEPAKS